MVSVPQPFSVGTKWRRADVLSGCKYVCEWLQSIAISFAFLAYLLVVNTFKFSHVSELIKMWLLFPYTILDKICIFRKKGVQDR